MELSVSDLEIEIKQISKLRNIHKDPNFLEFIALKCLEVLEEETKIKSKLTYDNKMNDEYIDGHMYETFINSVSSMIVLSNDARNEFGKYISRYIEYGTGMYVERESSKEPDGWLYPTDENDRNPNKFPSKKKGGLWAWTFGQEGTYVYEDALDKIGDKIYDWVMEYIDREVKL